MRRGRNRTRIAREANLKLHEKSGTLYSEAVKPQKVDAESMVAASYFSGSTYLTMKKELLMMGIEPASERTFYRKQSMAEEKIINAAESTMNEARQSFSGKVSTDCRWVHSRNGTLGTVTAVDYENRTVLARSTLVKNGGNRAHGNYDGPSNMMESQGTRDILETLSDDLSKITSLVHDRDNKSAKILDEYGVRDRELHDPGHYRKNFASIFRGFAGKHNIIVQQDPITMEEITIKNPFYGLAGRLETWLNVCIKEGDTDKRIRMWTNASNHLVGDHSQCDHSAEEKHFLWATGAKYHTVKKILDNFLESQVELISKISTKNHTQFSESINSNYARHASKQICWKRINGRIDSAIIMQNSPRNAHQIIRDCCGAPPLHPTLQNMLQEMASARIDTNSRRRTEEEKKAKNTQRRNTRRFNKADPQGDYPVKYE